MKYSKNNRGITYLELIIVITISTIIVGFSTITIGTVYRNNVGRTADKLYSVINQTRNNAMTNGSKRGWLTLIYHDNKVYYRIGEKVPYISSGQYYDSYSDWNKLCSDPVKIKYGVFDLSEDEPIELAFKQSTGDCLGIYEPEAEATGVTMGPIIGDYVSFSALKGTNYNSEMLVYKIGGKIERQ